MGVISSENAKWRKHPKSFDAKKYKKISYNFALPKELRGQYECSSQLATDLKALFKSSRNGTGKITDELYFLLLFEVARRMAYRRRTSDEGGFDKLPIAHAICMKIELLSLDDKNICKYDDVISTNGRYDLQNPKGKYNCFSEEYAEDRGLNLKNLRNAYHGELMKKILKTHIETSNQESSNVIKYIINFTQVSYENDNIVLEYDRFFEKDIKDYFLEEAINVRQEIFLRIKSTYNNLIKRLKSMNVQLLDANQIVFSTIDKDDVATGGVICMAIELLTEGKFFYTTIFRPGSKCYCFDNNLNTDAVAKVKYEHTKMKVKKLFCPVTENEVEQAIENMAKVKI